MSGKPSPPTLLLFRSVLALLGPVTCLIKCRNQLVPQKQTNKWNNLWDLYWCLFRSSFNEVFIVVSNRSLVQLLLDLFLGTWLWKGIVNVIFKNQFPHVCCWYIEYCCVYSFVASLLILASLINSNNHYVDSFRFSKFTIILFVNNGRFGFFLPSSQTLIYFSSCLSKPVRTSIIKRFFWKLILLVGQFNN